MTWAVMCARGVGHMFVMKGIRNSVKYIDVLKDYLLPQINDWFREDDTNFCKADAMSYIENIHKVP